MKELSKENAFILECVRSSICNIPVSFDFQNDISFEKVFRAAQSHRIMGLVFNALKPLEENIPREIFEKMSAVNKMMIMSSVARNGSIEEVSKIFHENNIRFVLLKGAVLQDLYPEKYMRYSTDTDILVKQKDYEKTVSLLKELSYKFESRNDKHFVFWKKPYICVEIHNKLVSGSGFFDSAWENVAEENGSLVMKKEFELTYLLCHMAENFSKTAGIGIHSVIDIYLYLKKYENRLDREALEKYLEKCRLKKFFESIKALGEIWFEGREYDEFYLKLTEYIFAGGRSGNPANAASGNISYDKSLVLGKIKFFLSKIFLPYKDLKKIYPALEKAPFLLPVFWIIRIFGIVFRPEHHSFERAKDIMKNTDKESVENTKEILRRLDID